MQRGIEVLMRRFGGPEGVRHQVFERATGADRERCEVEIASLLGKDFFQPSDFAAYVSYMLALLGGTIELERYDAREKSAPLTDPATGTTVYFHQDFSSVGFKRPNISEMTGKHGNIVDELTYNGTRRHQDKRGLKWITRFEGDVVEFTSPLTQQRDSVSTQYSSREDRMPIDQVRAICMNQFRIFQETSPQDTPAMALDTPAS